MQLQVPEYMAWEPSGPFEVPISLVNYTSMIFMAVEMRAEASEVTILDASGKVACKTPRAVEKLYPQWAVRALQGGQRWEVKRDIREYCPVLAPGGYTYEVSYRANNSELGKRTQFVAFLGPQTGKLLVQTDATSLKYEDLVALLDNPGMLQPASDPAKQGDANAAEAQPAAAGAAAEPAPQVSEIRACVDKELADRGLNAYGDAKGTKYEGGKPPVDEFGRVLYVASKNASIRKVCKVPMF